MIYSRSIAEFIGAPKNKNNASPRGPLWAIRYREAITGIIEEKWKSLKGKRIIRFYIEACRICGSHINITKHHISYYPEIKVPLCRRCHKKEHWKYPQLKRPKNYRSLGTYDIVSIA